MSSQEAYVGCEAVVDMLSRRSGSYRSGSNRSGTSDQGMVGATMSPPERARNLNKERTVAPRSFQRTVSPKPKRTDGAAVEIEPLVQLLGSPDTAIQREAVSSIRHALKSAPAENKARLLAAGGIDALVKLLSSPDPSSVESAMAALLSMSLSDGIEPLITRNGGLESVVGVLKSGSPLARETAAAAIFTLSGSLENKDRVRQSGGVPALVDLIQLGSLRGKKDSALALFNLALDEGCAKAIIAEGAVPALFALLCGDSDHGLEDKVVAVVANLAKHQEGREAIFAVENSVGILVDIVDGGSPRSKEDAVVALYAIATNVPQATKAILDESAMPALGKLSLSGTQRAKAKSKGLLELLRAAKGSPGRSSYRDSPVSSPPVTKSNLKVAICDLLGTSRLPFAHGHEGVSHSLKRKHSELLHLDPDDHNASYAPVDKTIHVDWKWEVDTYLQEPKGPMGTKMNVLE